MKRELLQQARILDPVSNTDQVKDVLIVDGKIAAIGDHLSEIPEQTQVRDCRGQILGSGLVDLYSSSGEPGFEERETLTSLLQAAAAGGFTRLAILPSTHPAIDNPAHLTDLLQKRQALVSTQAPVPHLACWAALTLDTKGQQMTELGELAAAGAAGFTDGKPLSNLLLIRRLLEYLRPLNRPVALWPYHPELAGNGVMREGPDSLRFGLPGNPEFSETALLAALLEIIGAIGTPVHLMRLSTARSVALVREAKERGIPITASTTWMHLLLNSEAIQSYHPALRLNPPLGNPADQAALIQAVRDGVIDVIAIDHSPYTYEEKTVAFAEAPPGAIGLELALPLLWQGLVQSGQLSALQLWQALSLQPTGCLQQIPTTIAPDQVAELVLFDPEQPWQPDHQTLRSLSRNTPWLNQPITGKVVKVWCPQQFAV